MNTSTKLCRLTRIVNGSTPSSDNPNYWDGLIKWVTPVDLSHIVGSKYIGDSIRTITKEGYLSCGTTLVPKGSIVLSTRAPIGLIAVAADKLCTNQGCKSIVVDQKKIHSEFLYYYLLAKKVELQNSGSGSTFLELSSDSLKALEIEIPDIEDQKKIANFLDHKVAKINESIAKKKKLLALLEEKRTSVINDNIQKAKGEKTKIKHVVKINPNTRNNFKYSGTVSFVPMEAVSEQGEVSPQERKINDVISGYTYFEENDVVIAKITPCFENGKATIMKGLTNRFGFGTTEFIVLRADGKIIPQYLYYLIFSRHFRKNGINEMRGTAGQKRLTESYVGHYTFNLPDKKNQEKSVKRISDSILRIDNAKSKILSSFELLEEYKTSLISNAVTGRVKT